MAYIMGAMEKLPTPDFLKKQLEVELKAVKETVENLSGSSRKRNAQECIKSARGFYQIMDKICGEISTIHKHKKE